MNMKSRFLLIFGLLFTCLAINGCDIGNSRAITGVVWSDDNGNGLRDPGEQGIDGITVRIEKNDPNHPSPQSTVTHDGGFYTFEFFDTGTTGWIVSIEPKDNRKFTTSNVEQNPSSRRVISEVDQNGKALRTVTGIWENDDDTINAGLLPQAVAQAPTPPPSKMRISSST